MNSQDKVDPELIAPLAGLLEATGGGFDLHDIPGTRAMLDGMLVAIKAEAPEIPGVSARSHKVPADGDAPDVPVRVYRPTEATGNLPAILWLHGGGYVLGDVELDDLMLRQLAKDTQCVVVNVGYRLAPEHPFPAALDDAYATLGWLVKSAASLDVDRKRIAVAGASAGGGLAAGLALMARDRGEHELAFQLLIYPALDDRNVEQASAKLPDTLLWTRENALMAWTAYLGGSPGGASVSPYAAAYRAEDLGGLPPAYVAVGTLDLFFAENLDYTRRLVAAGVIAELHTYAGAYHAFDVFAPMARVSARFVRDRNEALIRALQG